MRYRRVEVHKNGVKSVCWRDRRLMREVNGFYSKEKTDKEASRVVLMHRLTSNSLLFLPVTRGNRWRFRGRLVSVEHTAFSNLKFSVGKPDRWEHPTVRPLQLYLIQRIQCCDRRVSTFSLGSLKNALSRRKCPNIVKYCLVFGRKTSISTI